jgi:putative membrane protein
MSIILKCVKASLCLAVCSLTVSIGVLAQAPATAPEALTTLDQKFVRHATADSLLEVELGRLAQARGGGGAIKTLGERLIADHGRLSADLQRIAAARGMTLPARLGRDREASLEQIGRLSGTEFDTAFSKQAVADHQRAVARYDQQAITARDPELKAWVSQALPTLREHLQAARALSPNVTLGQ